MIRDRNIDEGANLDKGIITIPLTDIPISQSDVEFWQYTLPFSMRAVSVRVYARAVVATATVDIKLDGATILSSAITPVAGSDVAGTISNVSLAKGGVLTAHVTTDGSGTLTDASVMLEVKQARRTDLNTDIGGQPDA